MLHLTLPVFVLRRGAITEDESSGDLILVVFQHILCDLEDCIRRFLRLHEDVEVDLQHLPAFLLL